MSIPMTPRGYAKLREELRALKSSRPELAAAIATARAHGDLSENADYDAAREKSGFVEAKIREIEGQLASAQVIDPADIGVADKVVFGTTVSIEDLDSEEKKTISIYGSEESDVKRGWISYESPLGRALIGKEIGDVARLELAGGTREYEILEVSITYDWSEAENEGGS